MDWFGSTIDSWSKSGSELLANAGGLLDAASVLFDDWFNDVEVDDSRGTSGIKPPRDVFCDIENTWRSSICQLWGKKANQLSIHTDFPRLCSRIIIVNGDQKLLESKDNTHTIEIVINILKILGTHLQDNFALNIASEISNQKFRETHEELRIFLQSKLQSPEVEKSPTVLLLKLINQHIIFPAYYLIKYQLNTTEIKDKAKTWNILINLGDSSKEIIAPVNDSVPPEGDSPKVTVPPEGDSPKVTVSPRGDLSKVTVPQGDSPKVTGPQEGDSPKVTGPQEGDSPKVTGPQEGDSPKVTVPLEEIISEDSPKVTVPPEGDSPNVIILPDSLKNDLSSPKIIDQHLISVTHRKSQLIYDPGDILEYIGEFEWELKISFHDQNISEIYGMETRIISGEIFEEKISDQEKVSLYRKMIPKRRLPEK